MILLIHRISLVFGKHDSSMISPFFFHIFFFFNFIFLFSINRWRYVSHQSCLFGPASSPPPFFVRLWKTFRPLAHFFVSGFALKTKFHCYFETAVCSFCGLFTLDTRWLSCFEVLGKDVFFH